LQDAHHPEIGIFLNLGLSACHDVALICKLDLRLETLPQCRYTLNVCIQQAHGRLASVRIWTSLSRNQRLFDAEQR
jgi:hypothetical protein